MLKLLRNLPRVRRLVLHLEQHDRGYRYAWRLLLDGARTDLEMYLAQQVDPSHFARGARAAIKRWNTVQSSRHLSANVAALRSARA